MTAFDGPGRHVHDDIRATSIARRAGFPPLATPSEVSVSPRASPILPIYFRRMKNATHKVHFDTVGIIAKRGDERVADILHALHGHLCAQSREVLLDRSADIGMDPSVLVEREELAARCDLAVVIGGDGTFLNAARSLIADDVPLLGINVGRLGFLVDISPQDMTQCVDEVLQGHYDEDRRSVLHARVLRRGAVVAEGDAVNDVVLHIRDAVRMIEFETRLDGRYVNTQRADGIVVSTPTGSTAYALSGGGPILHPGLDALVLVPICPHTLSSRPLVVDAGSRVEIVFGADNQSQAQVAFDGQSNLDLQPEDRIEITRHPHRLRLIHPRGYDYLQILRAKLRWGEQP